MDWTPEIVPMWSQQTMPKREPQSLGAPLLAHTQREKGSWLLRMEGYCVCIYIEKGAGKYEVWPVRLL